MNKKIIVGGVIIVFAAGLFYFSQKRYQPSQQPDNQPTVTQQPSTQSAQNTIEQNTVTIQNFAFNPGTLTVKVGTKATWINQDSTTHKIKSDTFNSPDLNQGERFEFIFNNQGSFDYICDIHPSMIGKIIVE